MQEFIDAKLLKLNDCECCEGIHWETPVQVENRPGLTVICDRVGTYAQFRASLFTSLSSPNFSALKALKTRDGDDFTIALLDAWATVADVLTFYQERIANESYLRTATERFSIRQLARLIGYELRPGVAASTALAFTVEEAPGSPQRAIVEIGTKVQSVPAPGQQAQAFETVEAIEARAEWNAMQPRLTLPITLSGSMPTVWLKGANLNLKAGQGMVIVDSSGDLTFRRIQTITVANAAQETRVDLEQASAFSALYQALEIGSLKLFNQPLTNQIVQTQILQKTWSQPQLEIAAKLQGTTAKELQQAIAGVLQAQTTADTGVFVFRGTASLFGYNAAKQILYAPDGKPQLDGDKIKQQEWSTSNEKPDQLYLDNAYDGITRGSFIAILTSPTSQPEVYEVQSVTIATRTDYGLSGKTTIVTLDQNWWNGTDFSVIRGTTVYIQSESLTIIEPPDTRDVTGGEILLNDYYPDLRVGQRAVLMGEAIDPHGLEREAIVLADVQLVGGYTKIFLQKGLQHTYRRTSVTINANAALATHGETVQEVMGSGDASQPFQHFVLRQPPLTFTSAATPSGTATTLQIRVNGLLWHEVPTLYGHGSLERIYTTRQSEEGKTTVTFGNGKTGGRLPTGQDNVRATYRKGIGQAGNVQADQLTGLLSRPLGLKGVTNPQAATGGDDPEKLEQARKNAPLTVLTLERIVSLQDYQDFARAFAGIAKSLATWSWNGQQRGVFLTVAGAGGSPVNPENPLYSNLLQAIAAAGDRRIPVHVKSYRPAYFRLKAGVKVDPDFVRADVLTAIQQALQTDFGFEARDLGQGLALSQVYEVMQAMPGVVAIDIDQFYRLDEIAGVLNHQLIAAAPRPGAEGTILAAELLMLDPTTPAQLEVMA